MTRYEDWPRRLDDFLQAASERPFSWGERDCCTLAADAVQAMTGDDPYTLWRGKYKSARGAARIVAKAGGLVGLWTQLLGQPVAPLMARRGDVVVVGGVACAPGWSEAAGVVDLTGMWIACAGPAGLVSLPLSAAVAAWRVG